MRAFKPSALWAKEELKTESFSFSISFGMSRNERLQEVEDLVLELAPCKSLRNKHPLMYEYFRELFRYHPEAFTKKRVDDIVDISLIVRHKQGSLDEHGGPIFRVRYIDGKKDTLSWRKCVKQQWISLHPTECCTSD